MTNEASTNFHQVVGGTVPPAAPKQERCRNCGYCPHCGRANGYYPAPRVPYWTYPQPCTLPYTVTNGATSSVASCSAPGTTVAYTGL